MEAIEKFPEEVIHLILSSLEAREAAKTSVLSKLWLRAWRTQPILQCDERYFSCRENFVSYVDNSLVRYQQKKISIEKLKFMCKKYHGWIDANPPYDWTNHLDRWTGIAKEFGLKKLELVNLTCYSSIPPKLLDAELLEDLSVSFCPFGDWDPKVVDKISCLRLKRLSFSEMSLDEGILEKILSICQCIEFLNLRRVDVDGRNLKLIAKNLKELHVLSCLCETLEVKAPNLEVFTCSDCFTIHYYKSKPCWLDLETNQTLKFLTLFRTCFSFCIKKFPKLEKLIIKDCKDLSSLGVSSEKSLEYLYLEGSVGLKYVWVDSLNTIQFDYNSRTTFIPCVTFTNLSTCALSNIHLDILDSRKLWRLKKLLRNLMPSRISLCINAIINAAKVSECFWFEEEDKLPIPLHQLSLGQPSSVFLLCESGYYYSEDSSSISLDFSAILDAIFWICRPTLIKLSTCTSRNSTNNEFTQFLVWKLMVERDENYCDLEETDEYWQWDLKGVKVDFFTENDQQEWKQESWDWETFLDMTSKVQVSICITCDWETSSYEQLEAE